MTILVTGATGTIGSVLVGRLIDAGHRVRALTRDAQAANLPEQVEVVEGDLTRPESLEPALRVSPPSICSAPQARTTHRWRQARRSWISCVPQAFAV